MKAYEIREFGIDNLAQAERPDPEPGAKQVVVRFKAASVNYRDLMMVEGRYNPNLNRPLVPFSDGAGEVVATGSEVTLWSEGDRVMPTFMQGWIDGEIDHEKARTALGGDLDGVLAEYGVFSEEGLVKVPGHLSYEEAATLPCAAVTAWNALVVSGNLQRDESVLLLGTGGVSVFGLQFAKNFRAKTIITSSSDEKLGRADILGANHLFNYRENEAWDEAALVYTGRRGVDHVVEVGGAGTLARSLKAVRMGGHIALIGVLSKSDGVDPLPILMKSIRLHGIFVGSRTMFEEMNRRIADEYLKPVVDRVFGFDEVTEALNYMKSGSHFGKLVVSIP
ncbi:MAG: NAD(P)-dependent alcohol dehydrogenase [Acidobacteria bacterium]|nr:MAG: NAD(P)-dependent alcohol dehydrogenase [Acidobacteriota bacterium]REK01955.1 MAG: NAD(P)-dependent alcohol dehydrogenase [Acidobacteriota bacterium]REK14911.1 MAG: NAD(P)-dependent alcohol dehydrogenase [Acidobacteriota bacterium]REK45626.1 MAG: NAD(P)-dependent alcohol dehydrogenase [Acidobacteriota bacterium]